MEWALELVKGFKSGDARATNIVRNSRNIVVPIINPDGFEASRTAGELAGQSGGRDETVDDTAYIVAGASTGGEYRRKNCRLPDDSAAGNCTTSVGLAENGVDPNRNYGGLWGGPGADATNVFAQTYRGPGPVLGARDAQHPEGRLRQPGDDADHQPHDGGARAARARPRGDRRPRRREPRLQGARRRDGQAQRLLQPEVASSSTTRPAPPRTGATTPPAATASRSSSTAAPPTTPRATATTPPSTPATSASWRSGTAPTRSPTTPTTPARTRTSTARATARRTTSPPRARSTPSATACWRARSRPAPGSA